MIPSKEWDFQEIIAHVCERPEMYVGERRFVTVAAWLNGYSSALSRYKVYVDQNVGLEHFTQWLSKRCYESHEMKRNLTWSDYVTQLFPQNDEALKQLPILFNEFLNHNDY